MILCEHFGPPHPVVTVVEAVSMLMIYSVPLMIGLVLWKVFVKRPRAGVVVLGLDEAAASYSDLWSRPISGKTFALYVLCGLLTFKLGLLAFDFYYAFLS